jgi:hypothetical protein
VQLRIHQALHGYSDGHRQLACSASISPKDARLMLVMSDVSGPGVAQTGLSYLTGYPLAESGLYALSMTWPAPEMPRPGCVWTHTLLIGFSDLAALDAPSLLSDLFRRPSLEDLEVFNGELMVGVLTRARLPFALNETKWFAMLATGLYEHPADQIWARRTLGMNAEDVVLRLWDQQWPRLRRSFKFCTLTTRDRSQESIQFDLQLTHGGEHSVRLRFASTMDGFEAITMSHDLWLESLVRDANQPKQTSLRAMLRNLGVDLLGGREAMKPICALHAAFNLSFQLGLPQAIDLIQSVPRLSSSALAKTMVLRYALTSNEALPSESLDFILAHLNVLSKEELFSYTDVLAQALWRRDPRSFIELIYDGSEQLRVATRAGAESISQNAVIEVLPQVADLAEPLLDIWPKLASERQFWTCTQAWPSAMAIKEKIPLSIDVLRAMILGLSDEGAINSALHIIRAPVALTCLQGLLNERDINQEISQLKRWIRFACNNIEGVAEFLAQVQAPTHEMLQLIACVMLPDAIPNGRDVDPWLLALTELRASEGKLPVDLCAYGFRRALGWRSKSIEQLLVLTFEPLHDATLRNEVPKESWNLLEGALPWVSSSKSWDASLRLRQAVAKKCVDERISAEGFFSLTSNEPILISLFDEVWEVWGGRHYLQQLEDAFQSSARKSPLHRLVRDYLKRRSKFW